MNLFRNQIEVESCEGHIKGRKAHPEDEDQIAMEETKFKTKIGIDEKKKIKVIFSCWRYFFFTYLTSKCSITLFKMDRESPSAPLCSDSSSTVLSAITHREKVFQSKNAHLPTNS